MVVPVRLSDLGLGSVAQLGLGLPPAARLLDDVVAWTSIRTPRRTGVPRTRSARAIERLSAALIDEDVVWHIPGSGPMAGDIHGREALFRFFDRLRDMTEGTFVIKEHDVLGTDDHVV